MFLYLVWFSLCSSPLWELRDNGVVKFLQFFPQSHVYVILIYRTWACVVEVVTKILSCQVYAISTYVGGKFNSSDILLVFTL